MNLTKSSNPVLGQSAFSKVQAGTQADVMTVEGAVNKTGLMFLILAFAAAFTWRKFFGVFDYGSPEGAFSSVAPWVIGGGIGGFIVAMVTVFSPRYSNITAPIYAVLEGLFLGGISAFFEAQYPGLVMRAVALTFGVFFIMLFMFRSGKIRATGKFRMAVLAATGGIALVYFISFIAGLFGASFGFLHGNSLISIGFSLVVVGIAALNLILDFDFIQRGADSRAPKIMEWYGAFGLMVTLVWLYIEILRLLSKVASRD
ncbi:Bax inhibitor-1/YccA family protein [Sunxiuqinia elliptica]|uniref:Putative YccA/Bax inhibitor family protein n=1 Tax=Sunxiuqinia elliptica TaxID=655355 RepID=A0A4R6GNQ1_9BACT|nr:Bax inhibitor-1/YccA family protein [Sunxiuqinia elliptica]TDN96230.1 putative YccA/Bax inhibitor family protein [Sunxiuqinia elliptica]TDO67941.1 putative YccA/Bax inhibitor family protein [Sunxiuqinia elliptica]